MAAPIGNQFWKLRSRHGMHKLFETPELLWEAACEYFQWCIDNPIIEVDFRGKDMEQVNIPKARVFTIIGVCNYCGCTEAYFSNFKGVLKGKDDDLSKGFSDIVARIESTIRDNKYMLGCAGVANPAIIMRDLGLREYHDNKNSTVAENLNVNVELTKEDWQGMKDAFNDKY